MGGLEARALATLGTAFTIAASGCADFGVTSGGVSCGTVGECPDGLVCEPSSRLCVDPHEIQPGDGGPSLGSGPETVIDTPAGGSVTGTLVDVTFHALGAASGVSFRCRLDDDSPAPCTSPQRYTIATSGTHTAYVQAVSAAGAVGPLASRTFTVDASGASVNLSASIADGAVTNLTQVTFSFTSVPADNVSGFQCSRDGAAFATCSSAVVVTTTIEGQHTFAVHALRSGVAGGDTMFTWRLDTTPPEVAISGPVSDANGPQRNTSPVVTGSAENFARVTLYHGTACAGATHSAPMAAMNGSWAIATTAAEMTLAAPDGETDYYAEAVDLAGNRKCSAVLRYYTDNTAPAVTIGATAPTTTPAQPSRNRTPQVSGTADDGAAIGIYGAAGCIGAVLAQGVAQGGSYTLTVLALPADAATTLSARATDAAGNVSCSAGMSYFTDNTPPSVSASAAVPATSANTPTMNLRPTVSGTTEPGVAVKLYAAAGCAGAPYGSGVAGADGSFSIPTTVDAIPTGTTTFYAGAVDAAGNSACSASGVTYYTNNTAPSVSITGTTPATSAATPSMNRTPTLSGNAPAGVRVEIHTAADCSGTSLASGTASSTNTFSLALAQPVAADGTTTFYARALDNAGNMACSAGYAYYADNTAPLVAITGSNPATSASNPSQNRTPTVSGTAETGATVYLYNSAVCTGTPTGGPITASGGVWSIVANPVAADGSTSFYAQAIDAAGNTRCSAPFAYQTDNSPPAITVGATTPVTTSANRSRNRLPQVAVTTEAGARVTLYGTADCTGTTYSAVTTASSASAFSIATTTQAPSDGTINYFALTVDAAGNGRCSSSSVAYYTDNTAPAVSISAIAPVTSATAPSRTLTPAVTVATEAGATVTLYSSPSCTGTSLGNAPTGSNTSVTITTAALPANGQTTLYAAAVDGAGNSACSAGVAYFTDTTPPMVSITAHPADPDLGSTSFTFTSNESGAAACQIDGAAVAPCAVGVANVYTPVPGRHTFRVVVTDVPGNSSAPAAFTWFVASHVANVSGNDAFPGTAASPFGTITHALAVAPSGMTVVVKGETTYDGQHGETLPLTIPAGVRLVADASGSPLISAADASTQVVVVNSNASLIGFHIQDTAQMSDQNVPLVEAVGNAAIIRGNVLRPEGGQDGIGLNVSSSGTLIDGNDISGGYAGIRTFGGATLTTATVQNNVVVGNTFGLSFAAGAIDLGSPGGSVGNNRISCNMLIDLALPQVNGSAQNNYWDHVPPTESPCSFGASGTDLCPASGTTWDVTGAKLAPNPCP
jgi:uncharacterized protein DUF1565/Big-like domain-containing protein